MGSREDALEGIDSYNQAGTLRTLRQFQAMTNKLPTGFHSGLQANGSVSSEDGLMKGFPDAFKANFADDGSDVVQLSSAEAAALAELGVTSIAYGEGDPEATTKDLALGYAAVSETSQPWVISVGENWTGDGESIGKGGRLYTFNSKGIKTLKAEGYSNVIALFLTSTVDWEKESQGWVKGFSVKMEIPGSCPIPQTDFAYYIAYIALRGAGYSITFGDPTSGSEPIPDDMPKYVEDDTNYTPSAGWTYNSATKVLTHTASSTTYTISFVPSDGKAELIGTSCPECGITNP
jgi:hypothetical protein